VEARLLCVPPKCFKDVLVAGVKNAGHILEEEPRSICFDGQPEKLMDKSAAAVGARFGERGGLLGLLASRTSAPIGGFFTRIHPVCGFTKRLARCPSNDDQVITVSDISARTQVTPAEHRHVTFEHLGSIGIQSKRLARKVIVVNGQTQLSPGFDGADAEATGPGE